MMPKHVWAACRGVLAMSAVAALLGGCVIATESHPRAAAPQARGGATFCEQSGDGRRVACGGQATVCQQSADGRHVACGGQATYCERSANASAVACGG